MSRTLFSLVAVGMFAGIGLGADLKSGPEPGKSVTPFHPLNVTGSGAGEKLCLV
jgi:hypothetical protein